MRRRGTAVLVSLVAALGLLTTASPTSAHTDACAPIAEATTTTRMYTTPFGGTTSGPMTFVISPCAQDPNQILNGSYVGRCESFYGTGISSDGHGFSFLTMGRAAVLTGHVVGVFAITDDWTEGSQCHTSIGARRFLLFGAAAFCHGVELVEVPGSTDVRVLGSTLYTTPPPRTVHACP